MSTWAARPTTYKGIRMRSRLEARFAARLDALAWVWEYEPRAFADERGQYLPDFWVDLREAERTVYIEVKPTIEAAFRVMERMQIIWSSEPDAALFIAFPVDSRRFRTLGADCLDNPLWTSL
jgi:hypothetical protein